MTSKHPSASASTTSQRSRTSLPHFEVSPSEPLFPTERSTSSSALQQQQQSRNPSSSNSEEVKLLSFQFVSSTSLPASSIERVTGNEQHHHQQQQSHSVALLNAFAEDLAATSPDERDRIMFDAAARDSCRESDGDCSALERGALMWSLFGALPRTRAVSL